VIRANGGWDNFSMIKIEDTECETKLYARMKERELMEQFGNGMNDNVPGRSDQGYHQDNRDYRLERMKQYYLENRDKQLEKSKQKFTCECGGKYTYSGKSIHLKTSKHQNYLRELDTR